MGNDGPEALRVTVRLLLEQVSRTTDNELRKKLASEAFDLAQKAEAFERQHQTGDGSTLHQQIKNAAESNILSFTERLYVERDETQRDSCRQLLLREERWFGLKQERLEMLQRLMRDCDGRLTRYKALLAAQRASGVATEEAAYLLDNMLDVQKFLRISVRQELAREDNFF